MIVAAASFLPHKRTILIINCGFSLECVEEYGRNQRVVELSLSPHQLWTNKGVRPLIDVQLLMWITSAGNYFLKSPMWTTAFAADGPRRESRNSDLRGVSPASSSPAARSRERSPLPQRRATTPENATDAAVKTSRPSESARPTPASRAHEPMSDGAPWHASCLAIENTPGPFHRESEERSLPLRVEACSYIDC
jgi:hypothetical protein